MNLLLYFFLRNCRDLFLLLTQDCDLGLELGYINIMCNIFLIMVYFFVKFDKICSRRFKVITETDLTFDP